MLAAHDYGARYLYMVTAPPPPSLISLILGAWSKQTEYTGKIPFTFGRRVVVVVENYQRGNTGGKTFAKINAS